MVSLRGSWYLCSLCVPTIFSQLKESESLHETARKDLAAVEKHCELEIAQMTRVMGDYKKEYDELFRVKDTELEQQKQQLEQLRQQLQAVNQQVVLLA